MNEWRHAREASDERFDHLVIAKGTTTVPEWGKGEVMRFYMEKGDRAPGYTKGAWVRVFSRHTVPPCGVEHDWKSLIYYFDPAYNRGDMNCLHMVEQLLADGTIVEQVAD